MDCPKCGFEIEEEAYECPHCGIVFARWEEHQEKKAENLLDIPAWYQKHTSPTARILRAVVGVISLLLGAILLLQGVLSSSFGAFLLITLYTVFGVYILLSSRQRVAIGRFAIEGLVLAAAAATAFVAFPSAFSVEKPAYHSATKPLVPRNVTLYIHTLEKYCNNIEAFIKVKKLKDDNQAAILAKSIDISPVHQAFKKMSGKNQEKFFFSHAMIRGLEPLLDRLQTSMPGYLPKGPAVWLPKTLSVSIKDHVEATKVKLNNETESLKSIYRVNTSASASKAHAVKKKMSTKK